LTNAAPCPDEHTLLSFVEGRLTEEQRRATAEHLDGCDSCQDVVTSVAPALVTVAAEPVAPRAPAPLDRGATIGRYVVLSLVGRGGMGEVYAAYDPELDRKVALKLLHAEARDAEGAEVARVRLLREAKAIAKLSHPNVVVVHDAGTIDARVFIAMEFVEGQTLGAWLKAAPRPWRQVLDLFVDAGRALAAAHAAGLVHRDFKPQNVMVGADGKVRVMDFGLAATSGEATLAPGDEAALPTEALPSATTTAALTRTGTLVGTPAYMAPEQFLGQPVDARTDQFSFCVSLHEGLWGERPFAGSSVAELAAAVVSHRVREPAAKSRAPAWLRRVISRGLAAKRDERYPSMSELLDALAADPARRARKWATAGAIAAAAVALAGVAHRVGEGPRAVCKDAAARFAGVWEPGGAASARKDAVHRAFAASGVAYAEDAFAGAARRLDDYVGKWISMYTTACEATHVRGEQSAEVLDLRMACLDERFGNVRALGDVLAAADAKVVENAVSAAAALPTLDRCADVPLLRAVIKPPEGEAARQRVEALRTELAQLVALRDSGQCTRAVAKADQLVADVRAVGYQPLVAQAVYAASELGPGCGDPKVMLQRFKEAHIAANASHHDEVAALASTALSLYAANRGRDGVLAEAWLDVARGDVARLSRETFATAVLSEADAQVALLKGDFDHALSQTDRALVVLRRVLGPDHPWTINGELDKGDILAGAGRYAEAEAVDRTTVAHFERVLGPTHPMVGVTNVNLGEALNLERRPVEAEAAYTRAVEIFRRSGSDPTFLGWALAGVGRARLERGQPASARAYLEEALEIREGKHAPPSLLGATRFDLARALWERPDERKRALSLAAAARQELAGDARAAAEIDAWLGERRGVRN
jgi:tetratricopeptide (TPR) repeat protein